MPETIERKTQKTHPPRYLNTKPLDPLYCADTSHQMTIYRITELSLDKKIVKPSVSWASSIPTPQTTTTTGARTISTTLNCTLRLLCSVVCKLKPKYLFNAKQGVKDAPWSSILHRERYDQKVLSTADAAAEFGIT